MWFKRQKHYPQPIPTWAEIQSLAYGFAYDDLYLPRRHEKWFFVKETIYEMDRPVGQVSQKNWDMIIRYYYKATRELMAMMAGWRRHRLPRYIPLRQCQTRGWTWTRMHLTAPRPRRRRFILPSLAPKITGPPPLMFPTVFGEGYPCRYEPEEFTVLPLVG